MPVPLNATGPLPRKILLTAEATGGVWTYALDLARGLGDAGVFVHLAVLGPDPTAAQQQEAERTANVRLIPTRLPLEWTAQRECDLDATAEHLQVLAAAAGADLVHLNAPAHAGTRPWEKPLVITTHSCVGTWWRTVRRGFMPDGMVWRARRTAQGLARADALIVPSHSFGAELASTYGEALAFSVVRNGRAPSRASVHPKTAILTAGRLWDDGKNIATLDAAAGRTRHPVLAAGPITGPNGERLSPRHLHLLGPLTRAELARWQAGAAVFVSPSLYEPFGLSVLEAAQAGAALVLSDIATFRELWDGAAAFVPPRDAVAWAAAIERFACDTTVRDRFGMLARQRAAVFTVDRMCAETLAVYSRVLSPKRWTHEPAQRAEA